jgi:two-component system chemotaxis response regulator CheB
VVLPPQVRVLVVDDSVVMRRVVSTALERDPGIARADFAGNGRLALAKIAERRPDVVVLDLEMPELDGFGTLSELRRSDPTLPVVLFSSVDERVAAATLEALSLGATDFVVKPSSLGRGEAEAYVAEHLTPLVLALAAPRVPVEAPAELPPDLPSDEPPPSHAPPRPTRPGAVGAPVSAVVIGVSTGGPDALATLVRDLPADLPVPVLVVQHMPRMFTRLLAERLDKLGGPRVREAAEGDLVLPGQVYIAPGDHHLSVVRTGDEVWVALGDGPPENSCRPAADVLFRSAAQAYGAGVLAMVLTGMGQDGLRGSQAVRAARGSVIVEDPATAVIGSMPGSVVSAGLAQAVLRVDRLAAEVLRRVRGGARA